MALEKINSPEDVKRLAAEELDALCADVRAAVLHRLGKIAGHVGPNLGIVEATVALHRVFDSPRDKIVFDVSHQCYPHKIITGRKHGFLDDSRMGEVTGYSSPEESEHDHFTIGHTSTSVSLACGLAKTRDLAGARHNVIAVLGDGSLSGGMAFEGLDNAAEQGGNLIIIFNDNQMSIAENHGGIYAGLRRLRETKGNDPCNFFKSLGLDYRYVDEGNDVHKLVAAFAEVKDIDHPIVVHINTLKGCGYAPAETEQERYHWSMPLGSAPPAASATSEPDVPQLMVRYFLERMKEDPSLVLINAAVPGMMGFGPNERKAAGRQFVDVGICEEHAAAFASGLAKGGARPVWGVVSTFVQRAYDQISQDICINSNPAVILVQCASVYGLNDVTHLGFFDIPLISNIPNMVYLAPVTVEEYFAMVDWALEQREKPVTIRVPLGVVHSAGPVPEDYSRPQYEVVEKGARVAIIALGSFFALGKSAADEIAARVGVKPTLVNPRFVSELDTATLDALAAEHELIITLEDGVVAGGFGEKIAAYFGLTKTRVKVLGLPRAFQDHYDAQKLLASLGLTPTQIADLLE